MSCSQTDTEDDHPILRREVEVAVQSLKKGKSAGVDNVLAELVQAGREDVITALTTICNKIWQTEEWPTPWSQSLVITHQHHSSSQAQEEAWKTTPSPWQSRQSVYTVTDDSDDDLASGLESLEFSSIEKDSGDNRDELYASLEIKYKCPASLKVKVETGAQGNILPLRMFRRMFPKKTGPRRIPS